MYQVYLKKQKSELGLVLFPTIILATLFWGADFIDVSAVAGIPKLISHQGQLLDSSSNLLGGSGTNFCFRFSLYDNKTVGLGNKLWPLGTPQTMTTNVKNGIYNINIGDTDSGGDLLDYNFSDNAATFLNIEVATSTAGSCASVTYFENLNPRKRITSAPYAFNAGAVFGAGQSAIGTTSPAFNAELTVEATTTGTIALIVRGIAGQIADIFNAITSEGKTLVYTKDGLLGVGTSTPSSALAVQGNGLFSGNLSLASLTATGTLTFSTLGTSMLTAINASGNLISTGTPTAARYLATSSIASIFPYASTTAITSSNSAHFATTNGNVGIGTTTPWAKLSVNHSAGEVAFAVGSSTATSFVIDASGNVGIGTTTPSSALSVQGNSLFSGNSTFLTDSDSATAFRIFNQNGLETLFRADTVQNLIKIGDDDGASNPTTLFGLDTKADAGDPAGSNGATYYNSNTNKFRCFENAVWTDCIREAKESQIIFFSQTAPLTF